MEKININNIVESVLTTYFFNMVLDFRNTEGKYRYISEVNKKRKVKKYTKMLEHKRNRK